MGIIGLLVNRFVRIAESELNDIWDRLQDHERYVYHYTRAATLTDHILPTGKLRFSRFQNVSDPREAKDWSFIYFDGSDDPDVRIDEYQRQLNELLKHRWRVGCFVSDVKEALTPKETNDRAEHFTSALHERGHSRPRMWAQYGEDYAGACLIFDRQRLDSDIRSRPTALNLITHADRVRYENPPVLRELSPDAFLVSLTKMKSLGIERFARAHVERHWRELFFTKAEDWEQEREYRWLVPGERDEDYYVDIGGSLVGIVLGDRFPIGRKPMVGIYASSSGVALAIMGWVNGIPVPTAKDAQLLTDLN